MWEQSLVVDAASETEESGDDEDKSRRKNNEIFAGLEADDTYRTVGKLWNSYQKEDEEGSETPIKRGKRNSLY
ncbi:unnamed protein product [Eruca vesicaria subsp. sativa]|uniref:Uncharacterized protein n=1 Tax=Eruca vesicaria subsp. sativa TaxID=29727 RepID=A0ABC8L336_ERUVS|nr:unnamed protein product [Eruca vesicaria subsp. sativa]